jgi:hypothetical protein
MKLPRQYAGVWNVIKQYWQIYGGAADLIKSPYLHVSIALSFVIPLWKMDDWYDVPLDVIPSILGFSLAGYAMFLAFGDENFRSLLAGNYDDGKASPFMRFNSTFLHFIIVQVIAILLSVNAKVRDLEGGIVAFFSCVVFAYSLLTALATAVEVYRCSRMFDAFAKQNDEAEREG